MTDDIHTLTPEQATERLATLSKEYNSATAGTAQSQPTLEQILNEQRNLAQQNDAATLEDHLNRVGLPPAANTAGEEVREMITGKRAVTPELRAATDGKVAGWGKDAEFCRKLFTGDPEAARLLNIAVAIRMARVEESK